MWQNAVVKSDETGLICRIFCSENEKIVVEVIVKAAAVVVAVVVLLLL